MKRYFGAVTFILITAILSGCAESGVKARLGEEFPLGIGQEAEISGENFRVKFLEVTEDSRCPVGVTCIWEGRVASLVELKTGDKPPVQVSLVEPGAGPAGEVYEGYRLAFHVEPYPQAGKTIGREEYRLKLTVSKP